MEIQPYSESGKEYTFYKETKTLMWTVGVNKLC